ncbi:hypothetical protein OIU78_021636 [Salix suchowensis]|nr:hypothetical protein OIU78_021636 [Salix suchowensis]
MQPPGVRQKSSEYRVYILETLPGANVRSHRPFHGFQQFTALPFLPFYIIVYAILEQDISDVSSLEFLQLQGLEFFVWVVSCSLQNNGLERGPASLRAGLFWFGWHWTWA